MRGLICDANDCEWPAN